MVLLPLSGEAQSITRNKKQQTTTTTSKKKPATTNSTTKSKQGSSSNNSRKSNKSSKSSAQQSSSRSIPSAQSSKSSRTIIPAVVQQAIDDMVWVEGGIFMMGATGEQGDDAETNEFPVHQVTLSGYYISKYEVTQELWLAVMGSNPSFFTGNPRHPVENVSWNDCQKFIAKLNSLTGKNFRLPTEAEWEYAARGGKWSMGYKYPGSDSLDSVAWIDVSPYGTTHPVGQKSPNELGLYDMSGNVHEFCQDWYGSYISVAQTNPTGPTSGPDHVIRGGGYYSRAESNRVSYRARGGTYFCGYGGLRLAMSF